MLLLVLALLSPDQPAQSSPTNCDPHETAWLTAIPQPPEVLRQKHAVVEERFIHEVVGDLSEARSLLADKTFLKLSDEYAAKLGGDRVRSAIQDAPGRRPYLVRSVLPNRNGEIYAEWYGSTLFVLRTGLGCSQNIELPTIILLETAPEKLEVHSLSVF
jgi:hypothetical protein